MTLPAYTLVNAGVRYEAESWSFSLTGKNLTDERYCAGSLDGPVQPGRINSYPSEPLTWGATFRMTF